MARWRTEEEEKRYAAARAAERADYENQAAKDAAYEIGYNEGAKAAVDKYDVENRTTTPAPVRTTTTTTPAATAPATKEKASPSLVSEEYLKQYLGRDPFSYDQNKDPAWQAYKNQYMTLGRQAAMDTYGKAVALTGGYGNSYAQGVSQQVEGEYAARAADKIPELYSAALDRYDRQGQEMLNKYSLLYSRERDQAAAEAAAAEAEEASRRWWAEYGLKADAQAFDQWLQSSKLSWQQQKEAAELALEEHKISISEYNAITSRINAETNQYEAQTGRMNANTNAMNAQTSAGRLAFDETKYNDSLAAEAEDPTDDPYYQYFTGSVSLKTDDAWRNAVNKVVADKKRGTFKLSSLYKYSYEDAYALLSYADELLNGSTVKNTIKQGTK